MTPSDAVVGLCFAVPLPVAANDSKLREGTNVDPLAGNNEDGSDVGVAVGTKGFVDKPPAADGTVGTDTDGRLEFTSEVPSTV